MARPDIQTGAKDKQGVGRTKPQVAAVETESYSDGYNEGYSLGHQDGVSSGRQLATDDLVYRTWLAVDAVPADAPDQFDALKAALSFYVGDRPEEISA